MLYLGAITVLHNNAMERSGGGVRIRADQHYHIKVCGPTLLAQHNKGCTLYISVCMM